jgi:hypothetical protein
VICLNLLDGTFSTKEDGENEEIKGKKHKPDSAVELEL